MDDLCDTLARKCLLAEAALDVIEDFSMDRVVLVQDVLEMKVCCPQAVTEVLCKDPPAICVK